MYCLVLITHGPQWMDITQEKGYSVHGTCEIFGSPFYYFFYALIAKQSRRCIQNTYLFQVSSIVFPTRFESIWCCVYNFIVVETYGSSCSVCADYFCLLYYVLWLSLFLRWHFSFLRLKLWLVLSPVTEESFLEVLISPIKSQFHIFLVY